MSFLNASTTQGIETSFPKNKNYLLAQIIKNKYIYILIIPTMIYFILFKLIPMFGLLMAFQNYSPSKGILRSDWVGFKNFVNLFKSPNFYLMFRNTIVINLLSLFLFFPLPILLSIMLNEVKNEKLKRVFQTLLYMPHFMSWVIIASLTFFLLSVDLGMVNKFIASMGGERVRYLTNPKNFWFIITAQNIWREMGWGTILFLAALSGVDVQIYEAAVIDGANRLQKILYITLPSLIPTIIILFILRIGSMFDVSLEQLLLMQNPLVMEVGQVFDTFAYNMGISQGRYSIGVTVGMFKGIIAFILVYSVNKFIKKKGYDGIY